MISFLLKNIEKFHNEIDAEKGFLDRGRVEAAVNAPFQTFGGISLCPSVFDKAARLFFGLVENHGFIDGNKRVALHATELFLNLNEYLLICTQSDRIDATMKLAKGEWSAEIVKIWLMANARSVSVKLFVHGRITIRSC